MTETDVVAAAAHHAEEVMGKDGFRYISAVVANCKMLALELEMTDEFEQNIDMEALTLAGYLHDISTVEHGFQNHHIKSAEMAVAFLQEQHLDKSCITRVEQAILAHTQVLVDEERPTMTVEGQVLYDADKLGRLSGLAVVTSLIEFGSRYPNRAVTGDVLAAILRHIEERFIELYQSLYTVPAREMARDKFNRTVAFLDGVIEHLSDATPV
jgi:hypothetical protein